MARHKEFDRDEALHKAMEVFWARGYEATSMQNLVEHMGISRQSLYDTFGDKHSLYLEALDRYQEVESRKLIELLERPGSVKKALRQLFTGVVEGSLCDGQRRGCLMNNAMSELAGRCAATAEKTRRNMAAGGGRGRSATRPRQNMAAVEGAFYRPRLGGKKDGELRGAREPRAVARFL